MATVLVVGGSISGLAAALALRGSGRRVHIVERDAGALPETVEAASTDWRRPTVPQARQSHSFTALGTLLLRNRAPDVYRALLDAGAGELRVTDALPLTAADRAPLPGDGDLIALGCRRSTYELVLARCVLAQPDVTVERGTTVRGVVLDPNSRRVTGVRTGDNRVLEADVVLDATGAAATSRRWLAAAGVPVAPDRVSPSPVKCYTRFYRLRADRMPGPLNRGNAAGGIFTHYAGILHPGDNGTFSVVLATLADDTALRVLRDEAVFTTAARATPLIAPWVAEGVSDPISDVHPFRFPDNVLRGSATTRQEPVPGLYPLGDAACVTDPTFGRGVSLALAHAYQLAGVLTEYPDVDVRQSRAVARAAERLFTPWYEQAVLDDNECRALWRAFVHNEQPPEPPARLSFGMAALAANADGVVWRRLCAVLMTMALPATLYEDAEMCARVQAALPRVAEVPPTPMALAPSRDELLRQLAEAAGTPSAPEGTAMSTIQRDTPVRLGYLGSAAAAEAVVEAAGPDCGPVELVEVLPTDPFGPLRQRSVDALLTRFVIDERDLATSPPLYEEQRILLVGRGHPLAGRPSVSYEEVADYGVFARPPDMPERTWEQIVPGRTPAGRPVVAAHTASNVLEMLEVIIAGTAVHPTVSSLATWLQHPDVVFVPIYDLPAVPVALTWLAKPDAGNRTADMGPAVRAFVDAVVARWAEPGGVAP